MMSFLREAKARKRARDVEQNITEVPNAVAMAPQRNRKFMLKVVNRNRNKFGRLRLFNRALKSGKARHFAVSSTDIVHMSFLHQQKSKAVAPIYGVSNSWVITLRRFVAAAFMHYQNQGLGHLVEMARRRPPLFTMPRLAYDEAGERLVLPLGGLEQSSTWHVLVARLELIVGWQEPSGSPVIKMSGILPAMVVPSPSAANVFHSLLFHPELAPLHTALKLLQSSSTWSVDLHEADGAYACDRLWAHLSHAKEFSEVLLA